MDVRATFTALNEAAYAAASAARKADHTDALKLKQIALFTDVLVDSLPASEVAK